MPFEAKDIRAIADDYNSFEKESARVKAIIKEKAAKGDYYIEIHISQEIQDWLQANKFKIKTFNCRSGSLTKCGIYW